MISNIRTFNFRFLKTTSAPGTQDCLLLYTNAISVHVVSSAFPNSGYGTHNLRSHQGLWVCTLDHIDKVNTGKRNSNLLLEFLASARTPLNSCFANSELLIASFTAMFSHLLRALPITLILWGFSLLGNRRLGWPSCLYVCYRACNFRSLSPPIDNIHCRILHFMVLFAVDPCIVGFH